MLQSKKHNTHFFFLEKVKKVLIIFYSLVLFASCSDTGKVSFTEEAVCFKLINNKYFSVRENNSNIVQAIGETKNVWEALYLEEVGVNSFVIKANNGNYFTYNNPQNTLFASEKKKSAAGVFQIIKVKEYYQLKTKEGTSFKLADKKKIKITESGKPFVFTIVEKSNNKKSYNTIRGIFFGRLLFQALILMTVVFLFFKYLRKDVKNTMSYKSLILIGFIGVYSITNLQKWNNERVIANDSIIYYEYLPAALIFNDMSFSFLKDAPIDFNGTVWARTNEKTGRKAIKFTMGMAIMYLPFFIIGHTGSFLFDYTSYGYSLPYLISLCFCGWFYSLLGLFFLRKILLKYYNDIVTSFTLISIALATNLFHYTTIEPAMTHPASFCLISMFIWFTIKWHNQKQLKNAIVLGLLMGLISLIRPTNALLAIVFIVFNITSLKQIKERVLLFWNYKAQITVITLSSIIVWVPQFLFWKYSTGEWFYFSYEEEGFFFNNPQIFNGLFSYRKGWLVYTPIMLFSLLGVFFAFKNNKKWVVSLSLFIPLNIFIIYSWWCWWYGGSFGSRPMIDSYALMAIPLASLYNYFDKLKTYLRCIPLFVMFLAISLNLFQTYQSKTCLHYDSMTKESYWSNFTTLGWSSNYKKLIEPPNYKKAIKGEEEYNLR
jgi:hypothetical protein